MVRATLLLACAAWGSAFAAGGTGRLMPLSGAPPHPPDNPPSVEKVRLGEMLFFEEMLSGNGRRSCGTCHKPELLFMDGLSRAWGLHESELPRKTPSLLNVGWQRRLFSDGRAKTLEEQAAFPLRHPREMNLDPTLAAQRIRRDPQYQELFERAFPGRPVTFELVAKAIATYERTLVSYDSGLDRYLTGDADALTAAAKRGMALFTGRAGCISCHHGPLLTDHQLHYTGVPEREGDSESGTKYKTPSLRDVTRRYSFMHNGYYLKLSHVIDHYSRGGSPPPGIRSEVSPIELGEPEKTDLIAFLESLSGRITQITDRPPHDQTDGRNVLRQREAPPADSEPQDPSYLK